MNRGPCLRFERPIAVIFSFFALQSGCGSSAKPEDDRDHGFPNWRTPSVDELPAIKERAALLKEQRRTIAKRVESMDADGDGPTYSFRAFGGLTSSLVLSPGLNLLKTTNGDSGLLLKTESGFSLPWKSIAGQLVTTGTSLGGSVGKSEVCDRCAAPSNSLTENRSAGALTIEGCEEYDPADIEQQWYNGVALADMRFAEGADAAEADGQSLRDKFLYYATVAPFKIKCDTSIDVCANIRNATVCGGPYVITINPVKHDKYGGRCGWIAGSFVHEIMHTFMPDHDSENCRTTATGKSRRLCACEDFVAELEESERACCFDESEVACGRSTPGKIVSGKRYTISVSSSETIRSSIHGEQRNGTEYANRTCAWKGSAQADGGAGKLEYDYCDTSARKNTDDVAIYTSPPECPPDTRCTQYTNFSASLSGHVDGSGDSTSMFSLFSAEGNPGQQVSLLIKGTPDATAKLEYRFTQTTSGCCATSLPSRKEEYTCSPCEGAGSRPASDCSFFYYAPDLFGYGGPLVAYFPTFLDNVDAIGFNGWNEKTIVSHPAEGIEVVEVIRWNIAPD